MLVFDIFILFFSHIYLHDSLEFYFSYIKLSGIFTQPATIMVFFSYRLRGPEVGGAAIVCLKFAGVKNSLHLTSIILALNVRSHLPRKETWSVTTESTLERNPLPVLFVLIELLLKLVSRNISGSIVGRNHTPVLFAHYDQVTRVTLCVTLRADTVKQHNHLLF